MECYTPLWVRICNPVPTSPLGYVPWQGGFGEGGRSDLFLFARHCWCDGVVPCISSSLTGFWSGCILSV